MSKRVVVFDLRDVDGVVIGGPDDHPVSINVYVVTEASVWTGALKKGDLRPIVVSAWLAVSLEERHIAYVGIVSIRENCVIAADGNSFASGVEHMCEVGVVKSPIEGSVVELWGDVSHRRSPVVQSINSCTKKSRQKSRSAV